MFNLDRWLDKYIEAVDAAFGARIVFIGLRKAAMRAAKRTKAATLTLF